MALSNLDTNLLWTDLDALSPRSNTAIDTLADTVTDNTDGTYDTAEVHIDCNTKKFYFKSAATNSFEYPGSGITGQALYSFFKYVWKNVESITKFDFPMLSITNEQFEFINGWSIDDTQDITQVISNTASVTVEAGSLTVLTTADTTVDFRQYQANDTITITSASNNGVVRTVVSSTKTSITVNTALTAQAGESTEIEVNFIVNTTQLIRTAGFTILDNSGTNTYTKKINAGVITLGSLVDITDQPYFIQLNSNTARTSNLTYTGPANESVTVYAKADANTASGNGEEDIVFTAPSVPGTDPGTITSTTTDLSVFKPGDTITITNSASNNFTFTVKAVASATSMTVWGTSGGDAQDVTTETAVGATILFDGRSTYKIFVRERGKTYADADLLDIGVTGNMTYIVYRFPVSNATDLKITTTADTQIDSDGAVPASVSPYSGMQISYLVGTNGEYNILGNAGAGTYAVDDVLKDDTGRWYAVTAAGTLDATDFENLGTLGGAGTATVTSFTGERFVKDAYYAFTTIVDADDTFADAGGTTPYVGGAAAATVEAVYEFCQWALRLDGKLNEGATGVAIRNGNIADLLVEFVGDTLVTKPGVFVESLAATEQTSVQFTEKSSADYTGSTNLVYPRVSLVTINFNTNLSEDGNGKFYVYYTSTPNANNFGTNTALQVKDSFGNDVGTSISNIIPTEAEVGNDPGEGSFISFNYNYDSDTTGGRTINPPADVPITVVAIGLEGGQYVKATGTIGPITGVVSLVAPLERNYIDPA